MGGFRIEGNVSGNVAEVDTTANLHVVTPTSINEAGYTALAGVVSDGTSGQWWTSSGSGTVTMTLNSVAVNVSWTTSDANTATLMAAAAQATSSLAGIFNFQVINGRVQIYAPQGGAYTLTASGTGATVSASTLVGIAKLARRIEASDAYRLRVGIDSLQFFDVFAGSAINTGYWYQSSVTQTIAVASGFLSLNSGAITTTTTSSFVSSYRMLPFYQDGGLRFDTAMKWTTSAGASNVTQEWGLGIGNTSTTAPTDGAFFRITGTGDLIAVLTNNSTEQTVDLGFTLSAATRYEFSIIVDVNQAVYYVNNIALAVITAALTSSGTTATTEQAIFYRLTFTGAAGAAVVMNVATASATLLDLGAGRPYAHAICGLGGNAIQGQTGQTMGSTAYYANSTAPTTITTLSNIAITAGYGTLGGQFAFQAIATADSNDYIIFAYQVPAASAASPGKTLYITGVRIDTIVGGTVAINATTPTAMQWGIAVGSTAVSLATAEAAGVKAPRRIGLGFQCFSISQPAGTQGVPIYVEFYSPLVANQGEYVHIIMKTSVGVAFATTAVVFRGTCMINGYFE